MNQRRLSFHDNGGAYISDMNKHQFVHITPDEVRELSEHYELVNTMEDVKSRLEERTVYGRDENGHDKEKYTHAVIRDIAMQFIQQKYGNESLMETYWVIMDHVIEENERGAK